MAKQIKGFCKYCGNEYTKSGMLRHLSACKDRKMILETEDAKQKRGYFELVITAKYERAYWLIVEVKETASLKDLDTFIRDIWVECCGHLSAFKADGMRYESYPAADCFWGPPAKSMNYKLKDVFSVGQTIAYEYDFGSTTNLLITVHSYRTGAEKKESVTVLSRNNPPEILCDQCGENHAEWVDAEGMYDENPFWCEECIQKAKQEDAESDDDYDDEYADDFPEGYWLPVCNSPRMGVCGYEGSEKYPDQFVPDKGKK